MAWRVGEWLGELANGWRVDHVVDDERVLSGRLGMVAGGWPDEWVLVEMGAKIVGRRIWTLEVMAEGDSGKTDDSGVPDTSRGCGRGG